MKINPLLLLVFFLSACSHPTYESAPTKPVVETPMVRTKPITIVVDAGHGGKDQGAHKKTTAYEEKQLTLATAKLVAQYLEQMGFNVLFTRADDTFIPLDARCSFANSNKADLFVSIHYNAASNAKAHGIEVFYYKECKDKVRAASSKALADTVLGSIITQTQAKSRGVKHGNLAVVRETKMPAILVEGGFLTNSDELSKILTPEYRSTLARSVAIGVKEYLLQHGAKR